MTTEHRPQVEHVAWPATLAASAVVGSLALACVLPFAALATIAAATMSRGRAAATVFAVWAVNQAIGFGILGYPRVPDTIGLGGALLVAALAALLVAKAIIGDTRELVAARLVGGFAAAFAAYEVVQFGFAHIFGGLETFAPAIVLQILANDAIWLAALAAARLLLTRTAPNLFGAPDRLRLA